MGCVVNAKPWPFYPRYQLYRGLGGPQNRSGRVRKISPPPPTGPRFPDPPARSKSLYRLRYPSPPILFGLPYKHSHEVRIHFCLKLLKPSHVRQPRVYFKDQTMYKKFWYTGLTCAVPSLVTSGMFF
jgi:hypothetical protein